MSRETLAHTSKYGQELTVGPGLQLGLHRWLRADSYKLDEAEARLRAHAEWRASYISKGRIDEVRVWPGSGFMTTQWRLPVHA